MWIQSLLLTVFCIGANALPDGAPSGACSNLLPSPTSHGPEQTTASPYSVSTDAMDNYYKSDPIKIMLTGDNMQLRGIICQVRKDGDAPIGMFSVPEAKQSMYKTMMCSNAADTVTHMNRNDKGMEAYFMWTPPGGDMGDLKVVCSFVKETMIHWHMVTAQYMLKYKMDTDGMESSEESEESGAGYISGYLSMFVVLVVNFLRKILDGF